MLDSALELFTENGYEKTSLDEIAEHAGVSKQTIYSHFEGKTGLLRSAIEDRCREAMLTAEGIEFALPPEEFLSIFADRFLKELGDTGPRAMHRLIFSESNRHPELGEIYHAAGPAPVKQVIRDYLRVAHERGQVCVPNPDIASTQFLFLLKSIALDIDLFNLPSWPYTFTREEFTKDCCEMFLRAYRS